MPQSPRTAPHRTASHTPRNPPNAKHAPKRLLPPLLPHRRRRRPSPSPGLLAPRRAVLSRDLALELDTHKHRDLQHIVIVVELELGLELLLRGALPPRPGEPVVQRPRVPRHDFEDDGGPVAAAVPDLARLDGAGAAGAGAEVGSAAAVGAAAAATALRGPGGAQGLVPDVGVGADVELRAHDCDFGGDFAGGGGGGGEGDAHGVEERVGEREEEVRRDAGGELGVVEALDAGRGRDGRERERRRERAEGEPRDVVEGEQLDLVARRGDFGFGLREDVPAGAASLAAFCAEESGDGAQFVLEFGGWGELVRFLGGGERVVPAFGFERLDGRGVGGGLMWN